MASRSFALALLGLCLFAAQAHASGGGSGFFPVNVAGIRQGNAATTIQKGFFNAANTNQANNAGVFQFGGGLNAAGIRQGNRAATIQAGAVNVANTNQANNAAVVQGGRKLASSYDHKHGYEVEIPNIKVPKVEIPKVEVPNVEIPKIKVPKVEVEVPKVKEVVVKKPADIYIPKAVDIADIDQSNTALTVQKGGFNVANTNQANNAAIFQGGRKLASYHHKHGYEVEIPKVEIPKVHIPKVEVKVPKVKTVVVKKAAGWHP